MNPMLQEALVSAVRHVLQFGAGFMVAQGVWTDSDATKYVGAAALAIVTIGWAWYNDYRERRKLVTAMATPRVVSEKEVKAIIKDTDARPPVTIDPERTPYPVGEVRAMGGQERTTRNGR